MKLLVIPVLFSFRKSKGERGCLFSLCRTQKVGKRRREPKLAGEDSSKVSQLVLEALQHTHSYSHARMVAEEEEGQQHQLSPLKEPTEAAHHQDYSWPAIRFDVPPQRAYHFHRQFRTEQKPNNFLKGVKWCVNSSFSLDGCLGCSFSEQWCGSGSDDCLFFFLGFR